MNKPEANPRILLVAATENEVAPFLRCMKMKTSRFNVEVLITGVGMVATAFGMGTMLAQHKFTLAINAGIAGSFDKSLPLGELVMVEKDFFTELGAEDGPEFIPIEQLGLGNSETIPITFSDQNPFPPASLRRVMGVTVNTVHGNPASIDRLNLRIPAKELVETMEGAAFYYACSRAKLPAIQIRSISNYVEKRDRSSWKLQLAIGKLNDYLIHHLIGE